MWVRLPPGAIQFYPVMARADTATSGQPHGNSLRAAYFGPRSSRAHNSPHSTTNHPWKSFHCGIRGRRFFHIGHCLTTTKVAIAINSVGFRDQAIQATDPSGLVCRTLAPLTYLVLPVRYFFCSNQISRKIICHASFFSDQLSNLQVNSCTFWAGYFRGNHNMS